MKPRFLLSVLLLPFLFLLSAAPPAVATAASPALEAGQAAAGEAPEAPEPAPPVLEDAPGPAAADDLFREEVPEAPFVEPAPADPVADAELSPFQQRLRRRQSLEVSRAVGHFGHDFFRAAPDTFAPVETMPVPAGYVIGPGDEIRISVWGMVEGRWTPVVDRDGNITIPTVGVVSVAGRTYAELETFIARELRKHHREFELNVGMGRLRTIGIYLVGHVRRPGRYTVSSLATLVNALFASGGPAHTGSLRDIRLRRGEQTVVSFDMYDFLLAGDRSRDVRLEPEDIIFVPPAGPQAALLGEVRVPAIYELADDITLAGLLALAGGPAATGYLKRVQVERVFEREHRIILDRDLREIEAAADFSLADGDIVSVYPASDAVTNAVTLAGHVTRPGRRQWIEGLRAGDLVAGEGDLLPESNLEFALIERRQPPVMHPELLFFNLGQVLRAPGSAADPLLQPHDRLIVYSRWQFREQFAVRVENGVNRPGRYHYRENMRLSDLVNLAGGLIRPEHPGSYRSRGTIIRRMPPDYRPEQVSFDLHAALFDGEAAADLPLYPHDDVYLFDAWELAEVKQVRVSGPLHAPGTFRWARGMTVSDLLERAGGLREHAFTGAAELTRVRPTPGGPETLRLTVNLDLALAGDPAHDLALERDDYLFVRPVPGWRLYETVRLSGEVQFPGTYTITPGETISDLIARAGGYTDEAYPRGAVFTREEVRRRQREQTARMVDQLEMSLLAPRSLPAEATAADVRHQEAEQARLRELIDRLRAEEPAGRVVIGLARRPGDIAYDLPLRDGDHLAIPRDPGVVSVLGAVYNQSAFVHEPGLGYRHYLELAGGLTAGANRREIYVIRADGSVVRPRRLRTLQPGDAVVVPERLEVISTRREIHEIIDILYKTAVTIAVTTTIF